MAMKRDQKSGGNLPIENWILASLPSDERDLLLPYMELINLKQAQFIYELGDPFQFAYFPNSGMLSLLSITEEGSTIEIAMLGSEGLLGIPALFGASAIPYRVMVQLPGSAFKVRANVLRDIFDSRGSLHDLLLRYTCTLLAQVSQSVVCNRFHTVEKRLCRWLLIAHDHAKADDIMLTHEILSDMLGSRRQGVTEAANSLKQAGLIKYGRGKVTILNRPGLESFSCECYRTAKEDCDITLGI